MYRVLASEVPVQERRAQRTHPEYKKPELMATVAEPGVGPGIHAAARAEEVELLLPLRHHGHLQPLTSCGWMVADRENSALAGRLIQ